MNSSDFASLNAYSMHFLCELSHCSLMSCLVGCRYDQKAKLANQKYQSPGVRRGRRDAEQR